jgi:sugar lactone lactonase YvrE
MSGRGQAGALPKVELVVDARALLGEGPHWDVEKQRLYWLDLLGGRLHEYDPVSGQDDSRDLGQTAGCAVPRRNGGFILGLQHGLYFLEENGDSPVPLYDPEADKPGNRFNDGKCDAYGRLWAGTMSMRGGKEDGTLYRVDTDLTVTPVISHVGISNGLGWSPDGSVMYYIDTLSGKVRAYDYDVSTGSLGNERTAAVLSEGHGMPDGMSVDEEGMLWVAEWGGGQVSRWDPDNGACLQTISIPAVNVTSCVFGGLELDELYITTARDGMTEEQLAEFPDSGGVFRVRVPVKGLPAHSFGG